MKTKLFYTGAAILVSGLVGCSSSPVRDERVAAITTTVDTEQPTKGDELSKTIANELESWDERVSDLRARQLQTRNKDRFKLLSDNISDMDKKLQDARENFIEMKTADTDGTREKYKERIESNLNDVRALYNKLPAE